MPMEHGTPSTPPKESTKTAPWQPLLSPWPPHPNCWKHSKSSDNMTPQPNWWPIWKMWPSCATRNTQQKHAKLPPNTGPHTAVSSTGQRHMSGP
eukprot:7729597-Lingulodinium_polyedra.AAC.1